MSLALTPPVSDRSGRSSWAALHVLHVFLPVMLAVVSAQATTVYDAGSIPPGVRLELRGASGGEAAAFFSISNGLSQPVCIRFQAGRVFLRNGAGFQDLLAAETKEVTVPAGGTAHGKLQTVCLNKGIPAPPSGAGALQVTGSVPGVTPTLQSLIADFLAEACIIEEQTGTRLPQNTRQAIVHLLVARSDLQREFCFRFPHLTTKEAQALTQSCLDLLLSGVGAPSGPTETAEAFLHRTGDGVRQIASDSFHIKAERELFYVLWREHCVGLQRELYGIWRKTSTEGNSFVWSDEVSYSYKPFQKLVSDTLRNIQIIPQDITFSAEGKSLTIAPEYLDRIRLLWPDVIRYLGDLGTTLESPDIIIHRILPPRRAAGKNTGDGGAEVGIGQIVDVAFTSQFGHSALARIGALEETTGPPQYKAISDMLLPVLPEQHRRVFEHYFLRSVPGVPNTTQTFFRNLPRPVDLELAGVPTRFAYYERSGYSTRASVHPEDVWTTGYGMCVAGQAEHSAIFKEPMETYPGTELIRLKSAPHWFVLNDPDDLRAFATWLAELGRDKVLSRLRDPNSYASAPSEKPIILFDLLLDEFYDSVLKPQGYSGYAYPNDEIGGKGSAIRSCYWYSIKNLDLVDLITADASPDILHAQSERHILERQKPRKEGGIPDLPLAGLAVADPAGRMSDLLRSVQSQVLSDGPSSAAEPAETKDEGEAGPTVTSSGPFDPQARHQLMEQRLSHAEKIAIYYKHYPLLFGGKYFGVVVRGSQIVDCFVTDAPYLRTVR